MMKSRFHITLDAQRGMPCLFDAPLGDALWRRLRASFPHATSAVLMGEHTHLTDAFDDEADARRTVGALVSGLRRSHGPLSELRWQPPNIQPITTPTIHQRTVRYVHLNPCRAGLVDDPLTWPYSTHRDVLGGVVSPWVDADRLASAFGHRRAGFRDWFHAYVASDVSTHPAGSRCPILTATSLDALPIARLIAAALAATRSRPEALRRRTQARAVFLALARRHGWGDGTLLRWICGVSKLTIHRHRYAPEPPGLRAAELCLSDSRLTAYLMREVETFLAEAIADMERKQRRRHVHSPCRWRRSS